MAGSIPPLVSLTPPPLTAFDDDEEEDEDEFGMYTVAEDIDYNECISFKEKNEVKQDGGKLRGEQDSTSQDSTTDSGLCPDSEGMSPTPHSDEERTFKQSVISEYDRVYQQPTDLPSLASRLTPTCGAVGVDSSSGFSSHMNLPNGHVTAEDPEDDFGNFENFESAELSEHNVSPDKSLDTTLINSLEKEKIIENVNSEEEVPEDKGSGNCIFESERSECKESDKHNIFETEHNKDEEFDKHKEISTVNTTSIDIENKTISHSNFSALEEADTNDSLEALDQQISLEEFTASNAISLKAEQNSEIKSGNNEFDKQEVEFDDFTEFKADFSKFNSPSTEQCDIVHEHSKTNLEQNHSEEVAKPVCAPSNDASDEEFSDFTEFSSSDCAFVTAQKRNSVENVSHIPNVSSDDSDLRTDSEFQDWVSVFPSNSSDPVPVEDGQAVILRKNDPVWSRLIPLETSPALSYQWAESLGNRRLLTALNIDSRNILMMPWMPRFAANLSCGPLQPVKALEPLQPLQPTPAPTPPAPVHLSSGLESVPDAHFDWVSSGLTNPLDSSHSSLLDLNFMMTLASHLTISPKPIKQQKTLGTEAETILSSLPDLSFMRKTYIDFPINEG